MDDKKIKSLQNEVDNINADMQVNNSNDEYEEDAINIIKTGISFGQSLKNSEKFLETPPKQNPTVPTHKPITIGEYSAAQSTKKLTEEIIPKIQKITDEFTEKNSSIVKIKIDSIRIGKFVTVIYGDFNTQKVLNGKVLSIVDSGITILSNDKDIVDPIVVLFDTIIDIFEVKRFKKKKTDISMFKINKAIREFFSGNEEELKHAYEQKISVKKLRQELKKKEKEEK